MKRFLFCLMAALAFVGCTDDGPDDGGSTGGGSTQPQAAITLTTTALNFATEGGSQNVSFTTSGEWTAQVINDRANDWCTIAPVSGAAGIGQLIVKVSANDTTDERSASIIIKSGTEQKTIKVTQKQKDALTVTASKFEVAAEGGTVAIEVKANIDFSYAVDGASQSWITYQTTRAMKTSTLVFDIAENDSRDKRQGTVTISSGELKEVVTIYQDGTKPTIVISKNEYVIGSEGGSVAVEVKSNVDVSVELPSDVEWLSESTTRAMSTNTYYFDVAENTGYDQRSATIVFTNKADNLTEEVTITQTQKDAIVLAKDNYVVDSEGDVIVIEVGHNVDFDVEIADSWITQDQTRTFVNDVLTFTVAKNTSYDNRESTIKFTSKDKSITQTATVYQAQSDALIVSKKDIVIGDEGGIVDLVIQSNVEFTVSDPDVSWVHSVATRALTTTTLQYEVDANTSYDQRVATLIVTNTKTKATEEVTITQTQKDAIVLAKSEYEIVVDGGALDFEIQTNVDVTVNTSATWIKQVTTRALESKMLFFDIAANDTQEAREGTITLSGGDATQTIIVKQAANICPEDEIWYTSADGEIVVPYKADAFGASIVSNTYVNGKGIIKFNQAVTSIGKYAFEDCSSLTSITLPNSVTSIGSDAFWFCSSLTSITIPNSVTSIGENAFNRCSSLKEFKGKFASKDSRCLIIDSSLIAFAPAGRTKYTIPNSVTSIGDWAFEGCSSLTSITIPNSVTSIGSWAFGHCSSLISITIPNSVTSIGEDAFWYCSKLTSITIPNSVTSIGNGAFTSCSSLTSINIPNSVTSIGNAAFNSCSSLTSITIPNSVTSIGKNAFRYCSSLTSINIPDSVTSIGERAFWDCSSLTSITIPNGVTSIEYYTFYGCSNLTSINIPDGVTFIGANAFRYCSSLTSITIPNGVTSIEADVFCGCSSLTSINIPDGVIYIGYEAFYGCSSLTSINIPDSVTSIGDSAFYGCSKLTSITIPNSVTSIGSKAFYGCSSLTSITIPNSVTYIGNYAFQYCSSLQNIICNPTNPPEGGYQMFDNISSSAKIYVPTGSGDAYKAATCWSNYKDMIVEM